MYPFECACTRRLPLARVCGRCTPPLRPSGACSGMYPFVCTERPKAVLCISARVKEGIAEPMKATTTKTRVTTQQAPVRSGCYYFPATAKESLTTTKRHQRGRRRPRRRRSRFVGRSPVLIPNLGTLNLATTKRLAKLGGRKAHTSTAAGGTDTREAKKGQRANGKSPSGACPKACEQAWEMAVDGQSAPRVRVKFSLHPLQW